MYKEHNNTVAKRKGVHLRPEETKDEQIKLEP